MRPITPRAEPAGFHAKVRVPGVQFLRANPQPTNKEYKNNNYWQLALNEMYEAYSGICVYLCHWIPRDVARATIDHYKPKVKYPQLAYEWTNFRLCSDKMNNYKDEHEDVLDPFALGPDWFAIDFSSYLVEPGPGLSQKKIAAVQATIQRLRLNADDSFVQQRCRVVGQYVRDEITLLHMDNTYPFIAEELRRQGLTEAIKGMYRTAK